MSFATGQDVMQCVESLIKALWDRTLGLQLPVALPEMRYVGLDAKLHLPGSFPRMTYNDVMSKYGTDKPDLRLDYEIFRVDHMLPADLISKISGLKKPAVDAAILRTGHIEAGPEYMRKFFLNILDQPDANVFHDNPSGGPGIFFLDSTKPLQGLQAFGFQAAEEIQKLLEPEDGDMIILQARPDTPRFSGGSTVLGQLVSLFHQALAKVNLIDPLRGFFPLWVIDFPLFSPSPSKAVEPARSNAAGLTSTHHPFTSPKTPEDVDLLQTNPSEAVADHYDLVINGVEIGGGSRRIHNAKVQRYVMEEVLRMPQEKVQDFEHLFQMLESGCPPHAGFALGFDRLVAVMLGRESVRDVIAFPKTGGKGEDPTVGAPSRVDDTDWSLYGLKIKSQPPESKE